MTNPSRGNAHKPAAPERPRRMKVLALMALAAAIGSGALLATMKSGAPEQTALTPAARMAPFVLTDQHGRRFDSASLNGKVALVFFGFTHCPDVCPTTLATMANVLSELGQDAGEVQPVLISVDPQRDRPETLKAFRDLFDTRIVMLTGSPAEIAAVAKAYHVFYQAQKPDASGNYTVDHTASVFLIDREGRFRSTFDFLEDEQVILEKVRLLIAQR